MSRPKSDNPLPLPPEDAWMLVEEAPHDRPVYLTVDLDEDPVGVLAVWRTTREKRPPKRGWFPRSFWSDALTRQEIKWEPYAWREAMPGRKDSVVEE